LMRSSTTINVSRGGNSENTGSFPWPPFLDNHSPK
jgi:hypothetical protein